MENDTTNEDEKKPKGVILRLNSIKQVRLSTARVLRTYARGLIDPVVFKNLIYGLNVLTTVYRAEIEIVDIEKLKAKVEELASAQGVPYAV